MLVADAHPLPRAVDGLVASGLAPRAAAVGRLLAGSGAPVASLKLRQELSPRQLLGACQAFALLALVAQLVALAAGVAVAAAAILAFVAASAADIGAIAALAIATIGMTRGGESTRVVVMSM